MERGRLKDGDDVVFKAFQTGGLALNVPISTLDLGYGVDKFPVLRPKHLLEQLAAKGFLSNILGVDAHAATEVLPKFWEQYKRLHPRHSLFCDEEHPQLDFSRLVPYFCHGDGGRGFKKKSIMILSIYSALGAGTRNCPVDLRASGSADPRGSKRSAPQEHPMGVNLRGHTMSNRWLFAGMPSHVYKKKRSCILELAGEMG